jgi:hypothetical protein
VAPFDPQLNTKSALSDPSGAAARTLSPAGQPPPPAFADGAPPDVEGGAAACCSPAPLLSCRKRHASPLRHLPPAKNLHGGRLSARTPVLERASVGDAAVTPDAAANGTTAAGAAGDAVAAATCHSARLPKYSRNSRCE